ncbi:MAG: phosphate ABC transporter permease PstA [Neomegalonema sp.]|nr:phosphate ABC transporter permease PstA [Neomegalonema sp.]
MVDTSKLAEFHTSDRAKQVMRKRNRSETWFQVLGIGAISLAVIALATLVWSIVSQAYLAVSEYYVTVEVPLSIDERQADQIRQSAAALSEGGEAALQVVTPDLSTQIKRGVYALFDDPDRRERRALSSLVGQDAGIDLGKRVLADPNLIGSTTSTDVLLSDDAQLYFKGQYGELTSRPGNGLLDIVGDGDEVELLIASNALAPILSDVKDALLVAAARLEVGASRQQAGVDAMVKQLADGALSEEERSALQAQRDRFAGDRDHLQSQADALRARAQQPSGEEDLTDDMPSFFIHANGGVIKLISVSNERAHGVVLQELEGRDQVASDAWKVARFELPENGRLIKDNHLVWLEDLKAEGRIQTELNTRLLTASNSRNAEIAGVWGALVGSFWTMIVTFTLAFPLGVLAAIYLEEFAPKNGFTDFIEVNINNLAAIPSIIFGLFGAVVFLSYFGWERSTPIVGGVVLALMSLPTIIIAARASVRAVPPSIRSAALGLGASKVQTVFHHVLPLAMPGIMTGSIIAMAQALGETAPLIMVGMNAFVADVPGWFNEPASVMPALIYQWSDFPETLFKAKTSMAIIVLLLFLVAMNALAVFLRKRFERRW